MDNLKERLKKNKPMVMVSMRIPEDVIADLKRIAPLRGFSGYQPLIRAYIGQGLRTDIAKYEQDAKVTELLENLREQGVSEEVLQTAVSNI